VIALKAITLGVSRRLTIWPYATAVIWVAGAGYFISFFDITNVAFGLPVFSKIFHLTAAAPLHRFRDPPRRQNSARHK